MKKLLILCLSLILLGCSTSSVKKKSVKGIKEIQYAELKKVMEEDVSFMLYLGRPDCGDCQAFEPILEDYLNKHPNEGVYYLNIKAYRDASLKEDDTKEEKEFYKNLYKTFDFNWTPTLEVITQGQVKQKYQYLDENYYSIKDRSKQIKKKKEFIKEFKVFMMILLLNLEEESIIFQQKLMELQLLCTERMEYLEFVHMKMKLSLMKKFQVLFGILQRKLIWKRK